MVMKLVAKSLLLSHVVIVSLIQAVPLQSVQNITVPQLSFEPHQEPKALLAHVEKLNAHVDSIAYLLSIDLLKTDDFLKSLERRLDEIHAEAKVHGILELIDTEKLKIIREAILYYRLIVNVKK